MKCSGSGHQLNSSCLWSGSLSTACTEYKVQVTNTDPDTEVSLLGEHVQFSTFDEWNMQLFHACNTMSLVTVWKIYHKYLEPRGTMISEQKICRKGIQR